MSCEKVKLNQALILSKQIYKPNPEEHLKYIGLEHIEQGTLRISGYGDSSQVQSNKYKFESGDILFGKLRPYFRKVVKPKFSGVCSTDIMVFKSSNREKYDQDYLYYMLTTPEIINIATKSATGTRMPRADWSHLGEHEVFMPSLKEQKKIAKILSVLDEKIELNNEMNKTLEEMAQAIFKRWFVDFEFPNENGEPYKSSSGKFVESELGMIPEKWKVGILGQLIEISSGRRPRKKSKEKTDEFYIPLIGASSVMGYVKEVLYNEKILIIGRVGTHGVVQRYKKECWPSDNTLVIKSQYYEYVYQLLKSIDYAQLNRGSTQPLITQTDIKNVKIIIPPKEVLEKYERVVETLFNKSEENLEENIYLSTLRDTLLPKLMSGEIRVPDAEREVEACLQKSN